jgi:hypothetical protein
MEDIVVKPWDTLWVASEPDERFFQPPIALLELDRLRLAKEWSGVWGWNLLMLSLNGKVVFEDSSYLNINDTSYPRLGWYVEGSGRSSWFKLSRAEAVFDVEWYTGYWDNTLVLHLANDGTGLDGVDSQGATSFMPEADPWKYVARQ